MCSSGGGDITTLYDVTGSPPSSAGAFQLTLRALKTLLTSAGLAGALGAVAGVDTLIAADGSGLFLGFASSESAEEVCTSSTICTHADL
jgi:hypothetical protein